MRLNKPLKKMKQLNIVNENCLRLSGDFTFYTITLLNQEAIQFLSQNPSISEIDLSGVKDCDSALLLLLLSLWRQTQKHQITIRFINLPLQLTRLIALSNLKNVLGV
jgi:ABC-type transporter Mla MlaB component